MEAPHWETVRNLRREVSRLDRIQRDDLGWVLPAVTENVTDLLGPEPEDDDTGESVEWNTVLLASFESQLDEHDGTRR